MTFLLIGLKLQGFFLCITKNVHIFVLDYVNLHRKFMTQKLFSFSSVHALIKVGDLKRRLYPCYFLVFYF